MEICYLIEILYKVGFEGPGAAQSGIRGGGKDGVKWDSQCRTGVRCLQVKPMG